MAWSLFDSRGRRKYLVRSERIAFVEAARRLGGRTATLCLTLAFTGARISEVLALTAERVDEAGGALVFESLKRRERGIFRAVPVPEELFDLLDAVHGFREMQRDSKTHSKPLWVWSRPTAWAHVKAAMRAAAIPDSVAKPKALRHAFGIGAVQNRVALSLVQKWLGHARIETTAYYATPVGEEERALAKLVWQDLIQSAT